MGQFITACLRRAGEILPAKSVSGEVNDNGEFGQILRNKNVHLLAIFLMLYIGVKVTIGGILLVIYIDRHKSDYCKSDWIVTFVLLIRGGGPASGYVSTGFFGGKRLVSRCFLALKLIFH